MVLNIHMPIWLYTLLFTCLFGQMSHSYKNKATLFAVNSVNSVAITIPPIRDICIVLLHITSLSLHILYE